MTAHDTSTEAVTALLEGVTPGPWVIEQRGGDMHMIATGHSLMCDRSYYPWTPENPADWRFIAAARELVPALLAERDAASARAERAEAGPKVKPLMWCHHPMGAIASPPTGQAYIIDIRTKGRVMFIKGMNPPPQFDNLEAAKAAAQADYEVRILSSLEKPHE